MDLFFYREPEEAEKEEQAAKESVTPVVKQAEIPAPLEALESDWNTTPEQVEWTSEQVIPAVPAVPGTAAYTAPAEDWAAEVAQEQWNNTTSASNWAVNNDWN